MDFKVDISARNCTNCGGNLVFDTTNKTAKCDSCGCVFDIIEKKDSFLDVKFKNGKINSINLNTHEAVDSVAGAIGKPVQKLQGYYKEQKAERTRQQEIAKAQMKKHWYFWLIGIVIFAAIIVTACVLGTNAEKKANEGKIAMPVSSFDLYGDDYEDVVTLLKNAGFTKVESKPLSESDNSSLYDVGKVEEIVINGDNSSFDSGAYYAPDSQIIVKYFVDSQKQSDTTVTEDTFEKTTNKTNTKPKKEEPDILTRQNNKDLKKLLSREGDDDAIASAFAKKYEGRKIEFDANIAYLAPYQDYTTRYNFMINYGDYSEDSQIGPSFRFTNVNFGDLNVEDGVDELKQGDNIHIVAKVIEFDEEHGIFELEPVSTKKR